eukprot:1918229-Prymnesium_polylepis.1
MTSKTKLVIPKVRLMVSAQPGTWHQLHVVPGYQDGRSEAGLPFAGRLGAGTIANGATVDGAT